MLAIAFDPFPWYTIPDMSMTLDYLAGFIDGEGGIYAALNRRRDRPTPQLMISVAAYNTDRRPLEALRTRFGGSIGPKPSGLSQRSLWRWTLTGRDKLATFADAMRGRLVIKAAQLAVLDDYLALKIGPYGNLRLPAREHIRRLAIYNRMRHLNSPHSAVPVHH